tara:strand:- start:4883 stop:5014 length:132 start_codon:yes stop_codon:yes gene_type:complete
MDKKEKEMFINETKELISLTEQAINLLTTKHKRLKDLLRILKK